jgi:hypothetical protein
MMQHITVSLDMQAIKNGNLFFTKVETATPTEAYVL